MQLIELELEIRIESLSYTQSQGTRDVSGPLEIQSVLTELILDELSDKSYTSDHWRLNDPIQNVIRIEISDLLREKGSEFFPRFFLANYRYSPGSLNITFELLIYTVGAFTTIDALMDSLQRRLQLRLESFGGRYVSVRVRQRQTKFRFGRKRKGAKITVPNIVFSIFGFLFLVIASVYVATLIISYNEKKEKELIHDAIKEYKRHELPSAADSTVQIKQ